MKQTSSGGNRQRNNNGLNVLKTESSTGSFKKKVDSVPKLPSNGLRSTMSMNSKIESGRRTIHGDDNHADKKSTLSY